MEDEKTKRVMKRARALALQVLGYAGGAICMERIKPLARKLMDEIEEGEDEGLSGERTERG